MTPGGARTRGRLARTLACTAVAILLLGLTPAPARASSARAGGPAPSVWTARLCSQLTDFQGHALDAREVLWAATAAPPLDRVAQRRAVAAFRTALGAARRDLTTLDRTLGRAAPAGRDGTAVRDTLREGFGPLREAFAVAHEQVTTLGEVTPTRFPAATKALLRRLDRATDGATAPLTRAERTVRRSSVGPEVSGQAACRSVGFEWAILSTPTDADETPPPPPATTADVAGSADVTAPALLLPGRSRPSAEITSLAAETAMTGRARTFFYGAMPVVETGSTFLVDCPSADAVSAQILGCYHDGRIYILAVTRPDVARIVAVTAAHEMLHAVYDALGPAARRDADVMTDAYFATTTDARLRSIVAQYDARAPETRSNELHSLIPTQITTMTPELDAYYAAYFRDRAPVLAAYESYVSVFDAIVTRYEALRIQVDDLRGRITSLRGQSDAAGAEANRLATEIDALRAQGRIGEANALVPAQNDAAQRAQRLLDAANRLVEEHNTVVVQVNAVAAELGGLRSALRPIG